MRGPDGRAREHRGRDAELRLVAQKTVLFAGSFLEVLKTRNMHQDLLLCSRTSAIPGMRRASPHLNTLGGPQSKPGGRKPGKHEFAENILTADDKVCILCIATSDTKNTNDTGGTDAAEEVSA